MFLVYQMHVDLNILCPVMLVLILCDVNCHLIFTIRSQFDINCPTPKCFNHDFATKVVREFPVPKGLNTASALDLATTDYFIRCQSPNCLLIGANSLKSTFYFLLL